MDKIKRIRQDLEELNRKNLDGVVIAAIYARVSSPNQLNNYSLDEQIRICRERCELMGWKVRYIFKDEAVSAKNTNRPMFKVMIEKAKQKKFDVLVFWRLDRLCRSLIDAIKIEKELREYGVALHSVTEQIDTITPVGRFNFRNLASAAELERDLIKERARMGMHARALQHKWVNKKPPLGYTIRNDWRLEVNAKEAELVSKIFRMYIRTKSIPHVAYLLNREGIKTKEGKEWSAATVKKILDNEIYIGRYRVAGVDDYVEEYKIIEKDVFEKAREIRLRFKRGEGKKKPMPRERKKGTIDKIFDEYFKFLEEMDEVEGKTVFIV